MNENKQKILNIFNEKVELKQPENKEKQAKIKQLIIETIKIEGTKDDRPKHR